MESSKEDNGLWLLHHKRQMLVPETYHNTNKGKIIRDFRGNILKNYFSV